MELGYHKGNNFMKVERGRESVYMNNWIFKKIWKALVEKEKIKNKVKKF